MFIETKLMRLQLFGIVQFEISFICERFLSTSEFMKLVNITVLIIVITSIAVPVIMIKRPNNKSIPHSASDASLSYSNYLYFFSLNFRDYYFNNFVFKYVKSLVEMRCNVSIINI